MFIVAYNRRSKRRIDAYSATVRNLVEISEAADFCSAEIYKQIIFIWLICRRVTTIINSPGTHYIIIIIMRTNAAYYL